MSCMLSEGKHQQLISSWKRNKGIKKGEHSQLKGVEKLMGNFYQTNLSLSLSHIFRMPFLFNLFFLLKLFPIESI